MRILLAEDEKDLNDVLTKNLREEAFLVDSYYDGQAAIDALASCEYDVAVLDIMMPKADGFAVLREIRQRRSDTAVIFLTAKDSIEDRVYGLDAGANDYLVKPFSTDELMARIRVLLRSKHDSNDHLLRAGDLLLDTSSRRVERAGEPIELTVKEYQMLEYMLYNKGNILSRTQIEDHVWDYDYEGGSNVVDVYIRYLRQKIDNNHKTKLIHTKRGIGYVIEDPL